MGELEGLANLRDDLHGLARVQLPAALHLAQVGPVHILHQEERHSGGLAEVIDRHDVGMAQARQRPGFAREALGKTGIACHAGRQDLERDQPVQ